MRRADRESRPARGGLLDFLFGNRIFSKTGTFGDRISGSGSENGALIVGVAPVYGHRCVSGNADRPEVLANEYIEYALAFTSSDRQTPKTPRLH